ncbi:MAG: STAS domain-containing protein [Polyangiaceae bacterium]
MNRRTNDKLEPQNELNNPIPILSLWGRLVVSLQGDIRDNQIEDLERRLLDHIKREGAEGLAIDASGVWLMDSHLCATLGRLTAAARVMGVQPVICGLTPAIAMTLETMGFDLEGVDTALGLESALERLGLSVWDANDERSNPDDSEQDEEVEPA